MKFIIVFAAAVLALASAKPSGVAVVPAIAPIAAPVSSQYHAQDELGQYTYGYANGLSAKNEAKAADGSTVGAYSYVDANGIVQSVNYVADGVNGFRVAATNLPVAPAVPVAPVLAQPLPVQDTVEVAEAKAKHLVALKEAEARAAIVEAPVVAAAPVVAPAAVVATAPVVAAAPVVAPAPIAVSAPVVAAPAIQSYAYGLNSHLVGLNSNVLGYGYGLNYGLNYGVFGQPAINTYAVAQPWLAPASVVDTPEVALARAEHLAAVEAVKARNA